MKLINSKLEIKAILSILTSSPDIKTELLNRLSEAHFKFDPMQEAWSIIDNLLQQSSLELPSRETFLQYPELSETTADMLREPPVRRLRKLDDARRLIEVLEYHRVIRRFHDFSKGSLELFESEKKVDVDTLISDMETTLGDMRSDSQEEKMYLVGKRADEENEDEFVEEIFSSDMPELIPSTFDNFDSKTGGFGATDFVILASHMKGGKSIMAMNMAVNMYMWHNLDIIYIPLEMSKQETAERILSKISGVDHTKVRTKKYSALELKAMRKAWAGFKKHGKENNCRFSIWPIAHLTAPQLRMRTKPMKFAVVIVDYLNLLELKTDRHLADWQRLGELSRGLKLMTKDINALVISPTQMNTDGEIRYAKAIKEHANTVWTWSYGEDAKANHILKIDQPAVRGWSPFSFYLREDFERMSIVDHHGGPMDDDEKTGIHKIERMKNIA